MLLGTISRLLIIVEPVVVIPDILSKKESTKVKLRLEKMNGKQPKIAILSHESVVRRKACCKFSFFVSSRFVSRRSIPINIVMPEDEIKELFFSSYINCTKSGISMNNPNIIRSTPIEKKTVLLLFIYVIGGYLKIFEIQHNKILLYIYFAYET